ncbi:MAG: lipocalin-like domain-containing protein [Thermoanaerobaculia bacterium]
MPLPLSGRAVRIGSLGVAVLLLLIFLAWRLDRSRAGRDEVRATLAVGEALGGAPDPGFTRAEVPREFRFPVDHGAHDGFRTEWWYVTANLFAADGRAFGAQLTFFRNALVPPSAIPASPSTFRNAHVWMAHFALGDAASGTFRAFERLTREGGELAEVRASPFRVRVESWSLASVGEPFSPLRLRARESDCAIDLELTALRPPLLQGVDGLSRKGDEPGNASYYYSIPRLSARGTVEIDGREVGVAGEAWLDREWSTSALAPELAGWDWFALQLDDGRELMYYRLRRQDGGVDPWSRGRLTGHDGSSRLLDERSLKIEELATWRSPHGATYPARWRLTVEKDLVLELRPRLANQELDLSVRYWEGAVAVTGREQGRTLAGHGFVELTGYDGSGSAAVSRKGD